jgi:hypothetical protein
MSERPRKRRGTPAELISNWREYDGASTTKFALAARNILLRVKLQGCCGHPGEPGC